MNKNNKKLLILALSETSVIMLLLGLFAPILAYADTSLEQNQDVQKKLQLSREHVQDANQSYQDSKQKFLDTRTRLEASRTTTNIVDLKNATRNFLLHSIDYIITRFEVIEDNAISIEGSGFAPFIITDNIRIYINQLEDLKNDVETAGTKEEFQAVIREIKDIRQHVNLEFKYFILGTANNKVDSILKRSVSISERIEDEVERLSSEGIDTGKLEQLLGEYNAAINDAENSHNKAIQLFDDHRGFDDNGVLEDAENAKKFLDEANSLMVEIRRHLNNAYSVLREIFTELKQHRSGSADLSGTGKLTASGDGKATMSGNLEAKISARGGILTITDYDGNAEVAVSGYGSRVDLGNGAVKYSGFNGTADISGSSVTVVILGDDIELTVEGTGSAILKGHGTYDVEKDGRHITGNDWAPPETGEMNKDQEQYTNQYQKSDLNKDQEQHTNQYQKSDLNKDQEQHTDQDHESDMNIGQEEQSDRDQKKDMDQNKAKVPDQTPYGNPAAGEGGS